MGERPTIADVSIYAYAHVAPDAGLDLVPLPAFRAWTERIAALPGYLHDFEPYPDNAREGAGRSIYG